MHMLQSLFYLTIALHVSGIIITHLQEHKTPVTTVSGNRYTVIDRVKYTDKEYLQIRLKLQLLLIMYIMRKIQITEQSTSEQNPLFQLVIDTMLTSATTWKYKQINTPFTAHSNQFQLFHDSSRQQYGYVHHSLFHRTYCIWRRMYIIQQL
jgi:hypothetical protein